MGPFSKKLRLADFGLRKLMGCVVVPLLSSRMLYYFKSENYREDNIFFFAKLNSSSEMAPIELSFANFSSLSRGVS